MSKSNDPLPLPHLIESKVIFEESFFKICRDQLQISSQPSYAYYSLITHPFAVAILASTSEGAYVINEEYRHPTGHILLSCPGGYVDPGENALQAAQRELLEETGYQAASFSMMGSAYPYAGFSSQKTIYMRATGATFAIAPQPGASEIIRSRLLMPQELIELMHTDGIELDGILCTALFFTGISGPS